MKEEEQLHEISINVVIKRSCVLMGNDAGSQLELPEQDQRESLVRVGKAV
jgi:hypothetical protein